MEATGHYRLSVHAFLMEQEFEVKVINPIQSEAFRKMYIRQTKNDSKDSFIIARIMRFGQFSTTSMSEEVIAAMRQLSRYRLAAGRAAFCDPILSEYCQSLRAGGKHHLTAVGAVSGKLCNTICTILKEDRPRQPIPPKDKF